MQESIEIACKKNSGQPPLVSGQLALTAGQLALTAGLSPLLPPLTVNFPMCLAPMVGLSHHALRKVIAHYTPAGLQLLWPTEMLSSWRLPKESHGQSFETYWPQDWPNLAPQLLGNEEGPILESVRRLQAWGASAIDINMGCPVRKALKHNYGVALMGDPSYAAKVVEFAVKASLLPVSVKLRSGLTVDLEFLKDFVQGLEAAGASWITLHPRAASEQRRGQANWSELNYLREVVKIPVIGNGDIQTSDDAMRMLDQTGCPLVMSGRALAARPWMVWQLAEDLGIFSTPEGLPPQQRAPRTPAEEGAEYGISLHLLLEELSQACNESIALRKFRFHVRTTSVWLEFGHSLYSVVTGAHTVASTFSVLDQFFQNEQRMTARTDLRQ